MSAFVGSVMGQIVRVWPVVLEGRAFVWVDELNGNVEFAVLHHHCRGLWFEADSFVLRNPAPLAPEVDPLHGTIERVGYSVRRIREVLLVVEVSDRHRWWVLYLKEGHSWVVAREFRVRLFETDSESEEELSEESSLEASEN